MIMMAPNSHARQKEGVQGYGEEEAGDPRKGGQKETPTPGADVLIIIFKSSMWDATSI